MEFFKKISTFLLVLIGGIIVFTIICILALLGLSILIPIAVIAIVGYVIFNLAWLIYVFITTRPKQDDEIIIHIE